PQRGVARSELSIATPNTREACQSREVIGRARQTRTGATRCGVVPTQLEERCAREPRLRIEGLEGECAVEEAERRIELVQVLQRDRLQHQHPLRGLQPREPGQQ